MNKFNFYEYKILLHELKPIPQDLIKKISNRHKDSKMNLYYLIYLSSQSYTSIFTFQELIEYNLSLINNICSSLYALSLSDEDKTILSLFMAPFCWATPVEDQVDYYENAIKNYIPSDKYMEYFLYGIKYKILDLESSLSDDDTYFEQFKTLFYDLKTNIKDYEALSSFVIRSLENNDKRS